MAAGGDRRQWQRLDELRLHPAAALVPPMSEAEFAAFRSDIARHGIEQPLEITPEGEILDGRHRHQAALQLDLTRVPVRTVTASDPAQYLLRSALLRRQLNASQKALLGIQLARREADEVATLPPRRGRLRERAAELAGVCPRTVQDVLSVEKTDPALLKQIKTGEIPAHTARLQLQQRQRYQTIRPTPTLPTGHFELIYADPPWQLGNPGSDYAPEQYYPTLPLDKIATLKVPAAEDALLYLWAVNSHLPQALQVMAAWGFEHRSCEVWVKPSIGMGVWTRNRHELLLIGRKGNASPARRRLLLDSVIEADRGAHSQKPAVIYQRLEHLYPGRSKLELYARGKPRPSWSAWGNQVEAP